jgi:hypothetical protein
VLVREPLKGKGPGYALESAGVEVRVMDAARIPEALETPFREGWQQGVTT